MPTVTVLFRNFLNAILKSKTLLLFSSIGYKGFTSFMSSKKIFAKDIITKTIVNLIQRQDISLPFIKFDKSLMILYFSQEDI